MGDIKSVVVSISAVSEISERKRTFSSLSTSTTSSLAAPKTRRPPRVTSTEKVRELVRLAITRLRVLLNENKGTRRPISQKGLFSYNYVEPLFNWWGANYRVLTTQCLGRVEASDALGSVTNLVNGASHNYAGFYKATSQAEELQRLCLEALPVSDTQAVPLLRDETNPAIADFFGADFCFTTSTGYGSNYIALPALIDCSTVVIMDENCHNSMFTGVFLAPSPNLRKFKHNNMEHLETLLSGCFDESVNVIVAIEGLYSMEADVPPLDLLHRLKKDYEFTLYCDEAHSFLSLGKTGRGCLEYWNDHHPESPLPWDLIDIRTGTLSKAVGGIGGIIVGKAVFQDIIREHIDGLDDQDNVSLPSSTMVQTLWVLGQPHRIRRSLQRLVEIARFCREELERFGIFVYGDVGTPILPIYTGRPSLSAKLSYALRCAGLLATPVCTPAVPFWESRVRINLSADFTDEEVNRLVDAVIRAAASVGMRRMRKISRSFFKTKVEDFDGEEDCNEASKVFDWVRSLIKMDAAMGPHSDQRQLFDSTCGPRILDIGHGSRAQYGIGAGGARWICGTFPPHLVVEDLIARATGMEAALTYADASIGLASTIAALARPLIGHTKHFMLFERGASQFVRDGLAMASKKDAPTLLGYVDLFQLVQQVRKLYRRNRKLCLTVYVRVGEDSAHHLLSSILEEIAAITGPESVMTILLHCTSQYLDPRQLISFPSRTNIHVLVCGSFNRIFGLPAGFLTGPQSLIRELRYTSRGYMFTTSPPPFIMDMLRGALEWNLTSI
ncbi:aminotransferase class I and II [Colletotrichum tamarilloi]|uniref:serine C-palmitoyltransferase n=1 Tax=Colletotrichum tamarilloi TaxID=1209934 RepID=A0ABQ9QGU4_9PEZI|nr:aminotransferase class I and II [Colletotrichum tamarilloi]KAK1466172.1 aminotransferase class I and II [Colletotrichum tamarilloi]